MDQLLYKYCDARGVNVIDQLRLKVTPPNRFNDPFEFTPQMVPELFSETARRYVLDEDAMREIYPIMKERGQFVGSFAAFRDEINRRSPQLTQGLIEGYPQTAEGFRRDFVNRISETLGVICLSSLCDEILMWGHYTNNHTGMVIGFDRSHPFWAHPELQQVEYTTDRAAFDPNIELDDPRYRLQTRLIVRRKSSHWAYEQEVRQLQLLTACSEELSQDKLNYYVSIEPNLISRVIVGCRFSAENLSHLQWILCRPEFGHVTLQEARLHEREFRLVLNDLSAK